jgi:choline-sulfatase
MTRCMLGRLHCGSSLILVALLLVFLSIAAEAGEPPKPNVLMIIVDDMNDWVGCLNGHPNVKTPNIDRLAARGLLFANAHVTAPADCATC